MKNEIEIDAYRLMHWMNARKLTPEMVAKRSGVDFKFISELTIVEGNKRISADEALRIAVVLNVGIGDLIFDNHALPAVIYMSRDEVLATRREIQRGGIHFYNYYSLPAPQGFIAPVLIDILCPADKTPTQNNGHLEPAITINLGPGHIRGLWSEEPTEDTYHPFYANKKEDSDWILGDSYLEPPFCPHTYARYDNEPTQILSYTVKSNLESFVNVSNSWSDRSHENMFSVFNDDAFEGFVLKTLMERHGYDAETLSERVGVGDNSIPSFLDGDSTALAIDDLKKIALLLGCDYRLLMQNVENADRVGRSWCGIQDSRDSIRRFKSYTVASMSVSPRYPDLMGLFLKVNRPETKSDLDIMDHSVTHYMVTGGSLIFRWEMPDGVVAEKTLSDRDTLWVNAYVRCGFFGSGSLIKMGNGEGTTYLDHFEMSNTFDIGGALKRGRHDTSTWTPTKK